ncbi:DNA translocase FtsK [Methylovirgula sp. 4M-Z18]|uniref:DNA translocase FtsK n=1 Tax=Methylovirgula sp. 4M-Z18 TaxID=2293567 RepID=UPI0026BFFDBB
MRLSQTTYLNAATDFQSDGNSDANQLANEDCRAEEMRTAPAVRPITNLQPKPVAPPSAENVTSPGWQKAFLMGPNVRFTRTREVDIVGRRPSAESLPVERPSTGTESDVQGSETPATEPPVSAAAPGAELAVENAAPPSTILEASSHVPGSVAARASESRFTHLSDFAFWDAMPFEGEFVSAIKGAPVQSLVIPEIDVEAEAIVAKYRVVECRRPAPAMNAPQVAEVPPAAVTTALVQDDHVAETAPIEMPVTAEPVAPDAPMEMEPGAAAEFEPTVPQTGPADVFAADAEAAAEIPSAAIPEAEPMFANIPTQPVFEPVTETETAAPAVEAAPRYVSAEPITIVPRRHPALPPVEGWPAAAAGSAEYEFPPRDLLQEPVVRSAVIMTQETLEQNAGLLESVLEDFGVKGEIIHVRPGPVVTLYEFEPAPGVKSSRVINLADDIARSMSALSARVAVVPGRNVIGIELPNNVRETVYFREMIESPDFERSGYKLALGLGKTIGGEPVIAELAKMPHLLVAGTTGSGKSVAINTMILSLLYRMTPEQCRLIMVDPKMLELSVYDGIPHLLTPVVTDPKKAVMALKWAVREMEDRYRKMSRLGVRNIDGYNSRVAVAREKGETIHVMVQTGFDKSTGAPIEQSQEMDLAAMPYIVVIVDEMADLMMVAGKEIEGAIQRLAQMARAAGIHLIMATQRPSVDVITGTIKANFPTRISFQVTSKIDSRTILGEQGAEQLLGQGDMLHMAGGGRISRVHGPFVSDAEVEKVVAHLKQQGRPEYLDTVTSGDEEEAEEEDAAVFDKGAIAADEGDDLYERAVKVILRDKKCSTSYIQRRLGIGYNRAASLVERMEKEGLVGPANHVGKREIISNNRNGGGPVAKDDDD